MSGGQTFSTELMSAEEKIAMLNGFGLWKIPSIESIGNPEFIMTDGTYGVRYNKEQVEGGKDWCLKGFLDVVNQKADESYGYSEPATCFPNGSSVACSWDKELLFAMGEALAKECDHYGVNLLLAPAINIRRTPLAGRGYEYYSEDPVVSGDLAASFINGLQANGVGACIKHFACNNSEYKRTEMDSSVDDRALREIYLHGFERAITKSKPWAIMSSYNLLNGTHAAENSWLLSDVLRDDWGFDGVVISDWYGVKNRGKSLIAGNDLAMPESDYNKKNLALAIENGIVTDKDLDRSCSRILDMIAKSMRAKCNDSDETLFVENHKLAQDIAAESIVLLKNERGLLPLTKDKVKRIAVLGDCAQEPVFQGSGCATTAPTFIDTPLDEIVEHADEYFDVCYERGGVGFDDLTRAVETAAASDVAIVFASTHVGFDGENGDRADLNIIEDHETLIRAVCAVQPNTIVVLSNSDSVVMPWADEACSILETFFSGQGMGCAVAKILFGEVNPSGKLTVTVPNTLEETPAFVTYAGENFKHIYSESIFVGYRYYDKRNIKPLFPFGHGLSYTKFKYSNISISNDEISENGTVTVSFDITNIGERYGKEVAQLYISAPSCAYNREKYSLKAFDKIALDAGKTKTIKIELSWRDFCYFNSQKQAWCAEIGEHVICVGSSSRDIKLSHSLDVKAEPIYPTVNKGSTMVDLMANPVVLSNTLDFLTQRSQLSRDEIHQKLEALAPDVFFGIDVVFSDMLDVDITDEEFNNILTEE